MKSNEIGFKADNVKVTDINDSIFTIELSSYVKPVVKEMSGTKWVLYGAKNIGYKNIIDAYAGSVTNKTIIDSYGKFIYGKGLTSKQKSTKPMVFATILSKLSKKDLKAVCHEYYMFGEASLETIYKKGDLKKAVHVPKQQVAPSKREPNGEIISYWHSLDFSDLGKIINKPVEIEAWYPGEGKNGSYIYVLNRYQVGKTYYSDPSYSAALPYAKLEEELATYYINHIQNGLSSGHILNMNNGSPGTEIQKEVIKNKYKNELAGANNAGKFIFNFSDPGKGITVESFPVSDAHKQYEFIAGEGKENIMIGHKVVSPILFGVKNNTGLGNNANEMEVAFTELMVNVIQPDQEDVLDHLMTIFSDAGYNIDLDFIPLRPLAVKPLNMSAEVTDEETDTDGMVADFLIALGEEVDLEEWEIVDTKKVTGIEVLQLNNHTLNLASVFSSFPAVKSDQDTDLFKVRYEYAGSLSPQRDFCNKMISASKVYRKEDIDLAGSKVVNPGFGPYGSKTYDIWLYKGGPNCKHFWQRRIYLRRNNERITAAQAQEILNGLEPADRAINRIQVNSPLVAKLPADMVNNGYLSGPSKKAK